MARQQKPEFDKKISDLGSDLFVKNLENIQGDERDIIIISTTFGKKSDGSFRQHFGPILQSNGYLTTIKNDTDFTVKLPTVISLYSDFKIVPKFYVTLFTQQKLNSDNRNDQVTSQNVISMTPRFSLGFFEAYSTWTNNEISGLNGGIGFRLYGFYIGSSSVITALANDSKQADFYTGFRWAFL